MKKTNKNTNKGMALGMCLGVSIGTALGTTFDNIAMGCSFGMCIGMAIGLVIGSQKDKAGVEMAVMVSKGEMGEENFQIDDVVFLNDDGLIEQAYDKEDE